MRATVLSPQGFSVTETQLTTMCPPGCQGHGLQWLSLFELWKDQIREYGRGYVNHNISTMKWQPTPVFMPRVSHGQRSLAGYNPWGHSQPDMTEWLTLSFALSGSLNRPEKRVPKRRIFSLYFYCLLKEHLQISTLITYEKAALGGQKNLPL